VSIERFASRLIARTEQGRGAVRFPCVSSGQTLIVLFTALVAVALTLSACSRRGSDESQKLSKRVVEYGQPVPKGGGRYKVGSSYKVGGRWYKPREEPGYDRKGIASWYGDLFHGRYTANGEIFDMDALTAAHPTLPLPSYVRVTNLKNGRSLVLRVNDRGPYAHDRIIDLSRQSARALGFHRKGTAPVRVQFLGPAPINGDDSLEQRVYASQPWTHHASLGPDNKKRSSRTQLAQAVQNELKADPMTVGSIPQISGVTRSEPSWWTETEAKTPASSAVSGERHFVQAASFNNKQFAYRLSESYADLGDVKVVPATVGGKTWYRVRLGPFGERHEADQALRAVVNSGMADARIVRN
jgi:rare lipoprotein A